MLKKIFLDTGLAWVIVFVLNLQLSFAQSTSDLAFNEILVLNDSANIDDFGEHSSWIEIFNKGYNTVDIGGCYLTDDLQNPTKYWIPNGDPLTKIPARCYINFWADGKPSRGILHLNFELRNAETIALFDSNGRTLLDKLEIKKPQKSNISFGMWETKDESGSIVSEWKFLDKITPASSNDHTYKSSSGEQFVKFDPKGVGMASIAMAVVFSALASLYLIFKTTGNIFQRITQKANKSQKEPVLISGEEVELSGEVTAAIAMALNLYQSEIHDEENTVLTIKRVARTYSPWSSKIYTLRKYPKS